MATEIGGSPIQESLNAVAVAAVARLAPELPTEISGVRNLIFKAKDAQDFEGGRGRAVGRWDVGAQNNAALIKDDTPPVRKTALRQFAYKAQGFGVGPLFDKILPLHMERTLEDQEHHLIKVTDHIFDDLVHPYVHKTLVVIKPLPIGCNYYAYVEGREIISNFSEVAGLAHMISTMRPDINHADEDVHSITAHAIYVAASALSIPSLCPEGCML
jgi:splicing factor 3B subunit 1